jgi:SSS family solute:Na+ symporter
MLAGVLAANMSSLDALSVTNSALFIRNLYQPLVPRKSERHYITLGRLVIVAVLLGGIVTALLVDNLLDLFKYFISIPAVFGAAIWLGFTWRRLTRWAVIIQVVVCFTLYAVIPNLFQTLEGVRDNPVFLLETQPRAVTITTAALAEDVAEGRAERIGQKIRKPHLSEPVGVFFDKVVRTDPSDPGSLKTGRGRFHAEIWMLSWFGIDFTGCSKAQLVATRFFVDALLPFVLLFVVSAVTRPAEKNHLDRFFARLHTPVQPTPELERQVLARAEQQPDHYHNKKIWPCSNWEVLKPGWIDVAGFGGSCVLVGVVILLLLMLVNLGR